MDFSAFVNILFGCRKPYDGGRYPGQAEFIKILFDALIPDDVYEQGILKENPIYSYKKRMLEYIFTGNRHIDPNIAATIKRVMDLPAFEGYFDDFSEDGLVSLSGDINEYGFDTTSTDVIKAAGSIMAQLIEHIADGKPEDVVVLDYKAREKGRRHVKDIVPTTLEYRDGKFDIKGELITVDMGKYSEEEADQTLRYVQALYEAYESRLKRKIDASNVNTMPEEMQENFTEQNRAFYYADSIRHNIEEMFYEGEDEFNKKTRQAMADVEDKIGIINASTHSRTLRYQTFLEKGIHVYFTYAPRNRLAISKDSTPEARAALDAHLRENLCVPVISDIEDSLVSGVYLYGTDNHLSTKGVAIRTERIIAELRAQMEREGRHG